MIGKKNPFSVLEHFLDKWNCQQSSATRYHWHHDIYIRSAAAGSVIIALLHTGNDYSWRWKFF
jgi:hypothetical protein